MPAYLPEIETELAMVPALRLLRKHGRGRQHFIGADVMLPTIEGRAFPGRLNIPVSARFARDAIKQLLGGSFGARGGKIRITVYSKCLFIG